MKRLNRNGLLRMFFNCKRSVSTECNKDNSKYFNLTPISDIEESVYFEALDEKLSDDSIKNIAITGSYGSGKSSILESYFTKRKKKSLRVSLASFCESKDNNDDNQIICENRIDKNEIEEQILQQIFYQLSNNNIPYSGFKSIKHHNKKSINLHIIAVIAWLISLISIPNIFILLNSNIRTVSNIGLLKFWSQITWFNTIINIFLLSFFLVGLYFILREITRILQKGQLKKIAMKSAQIELSECSALNKYIDELIYFFEATDENIVVIEDLDRFNSIGLFSKLREVNYLVNNSPKVNQAVKFIYAIRDDIFTNHLNRTKFFDFILPIVPVINTTNSREVLREYLKEDKKITPSYINDICLYIHDLRLLKNIVNEYRIYSGIINQNDKKRHNIIFSIIIYKNLFPKEFTLEHSNQGLLYRIFKDRKDKIIESLIAGKKTHLVKLEEKKQEITSERTINEEKLREEYIMEILKSCSKVISICDYSIHDIVTDNNKFQKLFSNPTIQIYRGGYTAVNTQNIDFNMIQRKVNLTCNYNERLELINKRNNGEFEELETQITKLKTDISKYKTRKISVLIKELKEDNNWKDILFEKDIEDSRSSEKELLALLIRKGYIDENYQLYMSYFYEGSLTPMDFELLINIKNGEGDNFNTKIEKIEELLSRISDDEFEYQATLNKDLICHLLNNKYKSDDVRLDSLLTQFINDEEAFGKYIFPLINKLKTEKTELQKFITLIVEKYYPRIWLSIENNGLSDEQKDDLIKIFLFLSDKYLKIFNDSSDNKLKQYLTKKENFIDVFAQEEYNNVIKLIKTLDIKFEKLQFGDYKNNTIFEFIYSNNCYILKNEMLYLMLYNQLEINEEEYSNIYHHKNYTTICELQDEKLKEYVNANIETYVQDIYIELEDLQNESEDAISSFIEDLDDEENTSIIENVLDNISTEINDIEKFGKKSVWGLLFKNNCVKPIWNNLLSYFIYKENVMDEIALSWLNETNVSDSITKINLSTDNFEEEYHPAIQSLMRQIIINNIFEQSIYVKLIKSFPYYWSEIDLNNLSSEKISKLIDYKKLEFNIHHYNLLINLVLDNILYIFTCNNISTFIEGYKEYPFNLNLNIELLKSAKINIKNKEEIVSKISIDNINNNELSELMGSIILQTKTKIIEKERIISVIYNCKNTEIKLKIFDKFIEELEFSEIDFILDNLGGKYKEATELRRRPVWKNNNLNKSIADKLLKEGYFNSVEIDKGKNEIKIVVRYS